MPFMVNQHEHGVKCLNTAWSSTLGLARSADMALLRGSIFVNSANKSLVILEN